AAHITCEFYSVGAPPVAEAVFLRRTHRRLALNLPGILANRLTCYGRCLRVDWPYVCPKIRLLAGAAQELGFRGAFLCKAGRVVKRLRDGEAILHARTDEQE